MEKKNSYRSFKALGQLYDRVCQHSAKMEFHPDWEDDFDSRILRRFDLPTEMLEAAENIKAQYDLSVRRILSQHSLGTEFELWTGFAMSKPAAGSDYKRSEDLGREYDVLKSRFREMCYDAAGGQTPDKIDPFVAAMYKVTEAQVKTALREESERNEAAEEYDEDHESSGRLDSSTMPLITFPWIFPWVMVRIAMGAKYNSKKSMLAPARRNVQQPVFDAMNKRHDADAETTHAEAKPSEALNIASQQAAEPSFADDAAGVSSSGKPFDERQGNVLARNESDHDKGFNGDAQLISDPGQKLGSFVDLEGSTVQHLKGSVDTVFSTTISQKKSEKPVGGKRNANTKIFEHTEKELSQSEDQHDGNADTSLQDHIPADADQDSDDDSDVTAKAQGISIDDMISQLAGWGE